MRRAIRVLSLLALAGASARADDPRCRASGERAWASRFAGDAAAATFTQARIPPVKGAVKEDGDACVPRGPEAGRRGGDARWLSQSFQAGSSSVAAAPVERLATRPRGDEVPTAHLDGLWLTTIGLMELEQTGDKAGDHALRGTQLEGDITGRRLEFTTSGSAMEGLVRPEPGWRSSGGVSDRQTPGTGGGAAAEFRRHVRFSRERSKRSHKGLLT
jgi:hypothetical protein